ncbi:prolyl oligopeptidase family serine peptidase [Niabella pedocola]|uniref:Prolyl oligopeptidase family serine peptidase n=1 Tax=Niabella pedocola TaxID=1752077 RepID=A0ABS8PQ61_9BACT|nr:prolyl oligopeptidase family serine peptidase [Niabella pedocola]MCD2423217.1 prolyl oligopeptidase family serine peptidase [Niabella pedocola]
MKTYSVFCLICLVFGLPSCKKKDLLKGFDKAALFAQPTAAEIDAVKQAWAQRNLKPEQVTIEESQQINTKLSAHIISFQLGNIKEYAAVLTPVTDQRIPVLFYIGGFGTDQEPVNSIKIKLPGEDLPFMYIVPAMKGQYVSMEVGDKRLKSPLSGGSRFDAFDGATDDVIASLNAVGYLFQQADIGRAMIRGGSRGGTVALLAGIRDQRFKRVAPVAFNSDFIALTAALYNDPTYKRQFIEALINGTATIAETRKRMIAASPVYFCNRLPKTQLHCGQNDRITPATQAELLFNEMKKSGAGDRVALFIYPDRDHNNIATGNAELENRINTFFNELLQVQPGR